MEFRPCIDIHNGKIKQIVGGSLQDEGNHAKENFISEKDGAWFASIYKEAGLKGGHIILLNPAGSEYYEATKQQGLLALEAYPGGLQIGGGVNSANAKDFIDAGASHVIVTSYVFVDGEIRFDRLDELVAAVGKEHIVLDLSCRKKDGAYYIVTDRWQKFTNQEVTLELLDRLSAYADEFLIHAVDVEGKSAGIETELVALLGQWNKLPVTYAGGVGCYEDLDKLREIGNDCVNVTIGSALDLFGGKLEFEKIVAMTRGLS